ncbi:MAG: YraN family protein [Caulobacterales bacterium]|nr:YraN family protein [Caulobacterales bacterium]
MTPPARAWRRRLGRQARRRGHTAEWLAAAWLLLKGYQILGFRLKAAGGEIDILARKGSVLALVEVKQRSSHDAALEALGPDQRRRLLSAGQFLVRGRRSLQGLDLRLDVMSVVPLQWPRHYRNLDAG